MVVAKGQKEHLPDLQLTGEDAQASTASAHEHSDSCLTELEAGREGREGREGRDLYRDPGGYGQLTLPSPSFTPAAIF